MGAQEVLFNLISVKINLNFYYYIIDWFNHFFVENFILLGKFTTYGSDKLKIKYEWE